MSTANPLAPLPTPSEPRAYADDYAETDVADTYLTFAVDKDTYGISIAQVTEILGFVTPMVVPGVPSYVRGVINLRGRIIPVHCVRKRFKLAEVPDSVHRAIIVCEVSGAPAGLLVDAVSDVITILPDQVDHPPQLHRDRAAAAMLKGVGKHAGGIALLLSVEALFDSSAVVHDAASSAAS